MPIYIYGCLECKDSFEEYKSYTSKKKTKCPKCKSKNVKKKIGVYTIIYRGDGFTKQVSE
jgi:putative FmdB family regulatory protein